jgi:DNA-binding CsgD family transcriptional regulator
MARASAALATLDKFNRGILLLDCNGTVTFANRSARTMAARKDGLELKGARLRFRCGSTQAALELFLAGRESGGCESLVLRTTGRLSATTYRVLVSRLGQGAGYSVFVYEPNGGQRPLPVGVLRSLYGLTPAEANLTNELFVGKTLEQAAQARGISINTAKYTLKSVFSKCEVSSRAELLLLLSLGPRTL